MLKILRMCSNSYRHVLPHFIEGKVCKGFGRGSKELGIPTANFDFKVIEKVPNDLDCGIYYGMGKVENGPVYKAVLSIGWNPYYKNDKKSIETYILHEFEQDFYGAHLKVAVLGHIRPERNFDSLEDLISEIKNDIKIADDKLEQDEFVKFRNHSFFEKKDCETSL